MGDILSQSEIDALLSALTSGDSENIVNPSVGQKAVTEYSFAYPSKFNKEQLRSLEIIFDNYSRIVSSFLTGYLRTTVHLEVINAEQLSFLDFSNALPNPAVLSIVDFSPFKGSIILDLSANIGYSIIDRVLGGPGLALKKLRDFSEIEKILLERVMSQMVNYLREPWENLAEIKPRLDKLETNSQFAQIISPGEMIALVSCSIKIGSMEGFMNFCIPHHVIEPIMDKLNTKYRFTLPDAEDVEGYREHLEASLESATIPISVVVGKTNIMVNDFVHLQPGDIIPLDSYLTSDLNVMVGNIMKFRAKPGISRGKNAIQITSIVRKEE